MSIFDNWHICKKCKAEWRGGAEIECPECGIILGDSTNPTPSEEARLSYVVLNEPNADGNY